MPGVISCAWCFEDGSTGQATRSSDRLLCGDPLVADEVFSTSFSVRSV